MSIQQARDLRANQTEAEKVLWRRLRELKTEGFHFRHQALTGKYIADFACHHARIVTEVDGGQHAEDTRTKQDQRRTEWLTGRGYRVLRFWNNDVLRNPDGVIVTVREALASFPADNAPTQPSPRKRGRVKKA